MVYHAQGGDEQKTIRTRGLDPTRAYRVRLEDRGDVQEITGQALAHDGVVVALPPLSAEIIHIEALDTGG